MLNFLMAALMAAPSIPFPHGYPEPPPPPPSAIAQIISVQGGCGTLKVDVLILNDITNAMPYPHTIADVSLVVDGHSYGVDLHPDGGHSGNDTLVEPDHYAYGRYIAKIPTGLSGKAILRRDRHAVDNETDIIFQIKDDFCLPSTARQ